MDITGKVAVVTGGAAGIGRATVVALARKGVASVAIADLDEIGGAETAALARLEGADARFHLVDVTDPAMLSMLFAQAQHDFGLIDIVFNNAGVVSGEPAWPETSLARLKQVIDVNLSGVVFGTRLAIEAMRGDGGVIINTSSIAAFHHLNEDPVYTATKAGVLAFTEACRGLADSMGIRVNTVCPGITATPLLEKTGNGLEPAPWLEKFLSRVEVLPAALIASAVIDLIEDETKAGEFVVVANKNRG